MLKDVIYRFGSPIDRWMSKKNSGNLLSVGADAPDFVATTQQGETVGLKDLKGKNVILWFYPKADTLGCTLEACAFRDRNEEFRKRNVVVLGVSFDSQEENKRFSDKYGFEFQILCDTERKIGLAYGACQSTTASAASRLGYIISPEGKIVRVYPNVDAAQFPELALNDMSKA
jgi:peroxiredoxin Q/BCP